MKILIIDYLSPQKINILIITQLNAFTKIF